MIHQTRVLPIETQEATRLAIDYLMAGMPVAFPTDTVYGLGVLFNNSEAINMLYEVKNRDRKKAIAVLIGHQRQLRLISNEIQETARKLAARFWPGPLTLVIPKSTQIPENLSPADTIGVRMPDHSAIRELMQTCGPLAATSANISGQPNPLSAPGVLQQLGGLIPLILDGGESPGQAASTVVDCTGSTVRLIREGPIQMAEILEITS